MPAVTADDFGVGQDSRRNAAVANANSLRLCSNGYVTNGKVCRKRPGCEEDNTLETGTTGLYGALGKKHTFYHTGSITHADTTYQANKIIGSIDPAQMTVGSGLNDMTSLGDYTGSANAVFTIEIDGTGSPDTFQWKKDSGAWTTGVAITGSAQTLQEGVQVVFGATTGHTSGDTWTVQARVITGIAKIHYATVFSGAIYVVAEYSDGHVKHHYLDDSTPTWIEDLNCPNSKGVIKVQEKIFAIKSDGTVPFSASGLPRNWTLANDAGFLPVDQHQEQAEEPLALGKYQRNGLVVFFRSGAQLWNVDPDPNLHVYQQDLPEAHTQYPGSVISFSGDLFYLGDEGIRSIGRKVLSEDLNEEDVGSPIDKEVAEAIAAASSVDPITVRYQKLGRAMWLIGSKVFVYGFSRTVKISPWAEWEFPWAIDDWANYQGDLYLRSGDVVRKMNKDLYQDDGASFRCKFWPPFLHAKTPGVHKQWNGFDIAGTGTAEVSFAWDPNDDSLVTSAVEVTGTTYEGEANPIGVQSASISPQIENAANEEFQFDAITLYFENLTTVK